MRFLSTRALAGRSARHPWRVVALWVGLLAAAIGVSAGVGGVFTNDIEFTSAPEAQRAKDLLEQRLRGPEPMIEQVLIASDDLTVDDPEFEAFVTALLADVRALDGHIDPSPQATTSYYELRDAAPEAAAGLVSADRRTVLMPVRLIGTVDDAPDHIGPLLDTLAAADAAPGFTVLTGGIASINETFTHTAEEDLGSELYAMPIAFAVLVVVFGTVVASFVPLILAIAAIVAATGIVMLVSQQFALSIFVTNFLLTIGLAVGIDYALFIVERFREERYRGATVQEAIETAGDTASRAVFFSGITVVIALLGMFVVPTSIFRALALGAIVVVLMAIAATLTLLPALLRLLAGVIDRLSVPFIASHGHVEEERGFWAAAARWVMRRPVATLIASTALLVALAVPYLRIDLGFAGPTSLPHDTDSYRAFEIVDREFSAGRLIPTEIVIDGEIASPEVQAAISRLVALVEADPAMQVIGALDVNAAGDLAALPVSLPGDFAGEAAVDGINRLRSEIIPTAFAGVPAEVLTGGQSSQARDFFALVDRYTPIVFAFVLSLSFVLLLLVFRSVVVPLKAILMNLLSVGAAYGAMVLVFQEGWFLDVLGFQRSPQIEAWIPLFLFTVLFGLSMDYQVFLLSRIRERYDLTRNNTEAVAFGLRSTANIITGAAAIMVVVFGGFALGDLVMFQQMGFGLAFAVFLDATVVRMVLVPSAMRLLGDWNWYLPAWLEWLPDLRVEGAPHAQAAAAAAGTAGPAPGRGAASAAPVPVEVPVDD